GSVNVPAIYELREGTTLRSAIEMAGGLATTADGQKAVVERIEHHNIRRVEEFPLDGEGLERALKDGDVVRIFSLSPRFQNSVTLRGNVAHPGRTEWHSGMRLKDVIPNQGALVTRDYWRATNSVVNAGERGDQQAARDYWRATNPVVSRGGGSDDQRAEPRFETQPALAPAAAETAAAKLHNQITRHA